LECVLYFSRVKVVRDVWAWDYLARRHGKGDVRVLSACSLKDSDIVVPWRHIGDGKNEGIVLHPPHEMLETNVPKKGAVGRYSGVAVFPGMRVGIAVEDNDLRAHRATDGVYIDCYTGLGRGSHDGDQPCHQGQGHYQLKRL
jgi:hypothetical protein